MPEADAFYLLLTVCETLMAGYYNRGMVGTMVDVHLFGGSNIFPTDYVPTTTDTQILAFSCALFIYVPDLIHSELPEIGAHLQRLNVPIPAITMPWLLCLYIGYLPMEVPATTSFCLTYVDRFRCVYLTLFSQKD